MQERHYDLHACHVHASVADTELVGALDLVLGPYKSAPASPDILLKIERCPGPPAPPHQPPRFVFPPLELRRVAGGLHLRDATGEIEVNPIDGRIHGRIAEGAGEGDTADFARAALWAALLECLRARGRFPLHAASAITPTGETLLFPGTRGAGKSTLLLSLLEQGWTALSDDTVFLVPRHDALEVLPQRKRFHVRLDLLARRPDLTALVDDHQSFDLPDKKCLRIEQHFGGRLATSAINPSRIYFCEIIDAPHSEVRSIDCKQSLVRLLEHSCSVFFLGDLAQTHLDVLSRLANSTRAFALRCGRDVLSAPSAYLELLATPSRDLAA